MRLPRGVRLSPGRNHVKRRVSLVLLAALPVLLFVVAACGSDDDADKVSLDLQPIGALARSAREDAAAMLAHADRMAELAIDRPDRAHWASDAETLRTDAHMIQVLADAANTIAVDHATFPPQASEVDIGRLISDGTNLRKLGEQLGRDADAMGLHLDVMEEEAAGDQPVLDVILELRSSLKAMRTAADAAIEFGDGLAEKGRAVARAAGIDVDH